MARRLCSLAASALAIALAVPAQSWATDIIATSGSAYIWATPDSYLGVSQFPTDMPLVHGVNAIFHSMLEASEVAYIKISADNQWKFFFEAPNPQGPGTSAPRVPLSIGHFENAVRYPFNATGQAGMDVSVNASGYSTLSGWFDVLDIAYDVNRQVTSLAIDFAEGQTTGKPTLFGSLRFNSSIPLTTTIPEPTTLIQLAMGLCGLALVTARNRTRGTH